ncbi:hypothetical protein A4H97_30020 [Niastella yeongjuensis]|uniref:Insecticide toxin TcdB middle/N-terminal domain-containing protein n=1 Tax=Niastella yeongjuensis TaxID=354355 RepID=A0A1V9EPW3_9BACT|nr:SpvB/TcaC N-terminal domain-containing protein [Niastella yeongjuensis]OQP48072.1 hypothetical protein A4H97_30020 [Niastella yeongjuensis]SEO25662.1 RHS repeat-associated core domain-containing protein [Niastella yeongjuensis]
MSFFTYRKIPFFLIAILCCTVASGKVPGPEKNAGASRLYHARQREGLIGVNAANQIDNPADNSFHVYLDKPLQGNEQVWLTYELDGVQDYTAVSRSINDQLAAGGYLVKKREGWARQKEPISTSWLQQGENIIRFSLPQNAGYSYKVRNLSIEIAATDEQRTSLIITQPSINYYNNQGYVRGFITGEGKNSAQITIDGQPARVWKGAFEALVNRPADGKGAWQSLVEVTYANGKKKQQVVTFSAGQKADYKYELQSAVVHTQRALQPNQAAVIAAGGAVLTIPGGALKKAATISLTALRAVDLPAMDMNMVNVTPDGGGFRFLPHGSLFGKPAHLSLGYDAAKIPDGYTAKDVRSFYFDESKGHWAELSRDSVSLLAGKVYSRTLHFTDIINGVLKVPESPQVEAYNSNSMKGIKAANPGEAVNMIAPPAATSMGTANLSYPIEIPNGRAGLQPELSVGYNSGGGNGWLGLGWELSVPSIGIDTRWGVPRFDGQNETETYTMNGQQLSPVAHKGELVARSSEKQFYQRIEQPFYKIIRHGSSPQKYWWEVTDKEGTRFFYGGDPDTGPDAASSLSDGAGNKAHWALKKVLDLNGNFISYQYTKVNDAGVSGGAVTGVQLYVSRITYTGFNGKEGRYSVVFKRDRDLDGRTGRKDVAIAANNGFKQVTADLLKRIDVQLDGVSIRHYEFSYKEGAFYKTLLAGIQQYDAAGKFFNQHTFDYYNDVASGSSLVPLATSRSWTIGSDNVHGNMLTHVSGFTDEASALSGTASKDVSGGVTVSVGFGADVTSKINSVGGSFSYAQSQSQGMLAMIDINGDGLPDKLFLNGNNTLSYRPNQSGVTGKTSFGDKIAIEGLNVFQKDKTQGYTVGLEANAFGFLMAGANFSNSTAKVTIYFTEANGDQLVDLVKDGKVYFNHLDTTSGIITFTPTSTGTPSPVFAGVTISKDLIDATELANERQEAINNNPLQDIVRMWQAPFSGTINVTAPLQLLPSSDPDRASTPADGVRASVQWKGRELWSENISADDYSVHQPSGLNGLQVQKGDRLYFRIGSIENGSYDSVNWAPVIEYAGKDLQVADANGSTLYRYDAAKEFILSSTQQLTPPINGKVRISGPFIKPVTTDDVMLVVLRTTSNATDTIWRQTYKSDQVVNTTISVDNVTVNNNEQYSFVVASQTNIDWTAISWQPSMTFIAVSDPAIDLTATPIQAFAVPKCTILANMLQLNAPYEVTLADTSLHTITITPQLAVNPVLIPASAYTCDIIFSVKAAGKLLGKVSMPFVNGVLQTGNYALNVGVHNKDRIYIEYHVPNDTMAAAIAGATAVLSGDISANVTAGLFSTIPKNNREEDIIFGSFYRGWGQFAWNGNNGWETTPVDESLLRPSDQIKAKQNVDPDALANKNGNELDPSQTYDPKQDRFIILIGNANQQRWSGYDQQVFVKGANMSSSRQGADDVSLLQINTDGTGSPAVDKVSRIKSLSFTVGASAGGVGGSASVSTSTSKTLTDFMDLNGDQYPDIIGEKQIQYTDARGGLSARTAPGAAIQETSTNTTGISLTGSSYIPTAIFRRTPGGKVRVDAGSAQTNAGSAKISLGGNAGVVNGTNQADFSYIDMNGDGLPDRVNQSSHGVSLNLGYGFAAEEDWKVDQIQAGSSKSQSGGASLGLVKGNNSINIGFSLSRSDNNSGKSLQDMNGDGLPDLVSIGSGTQALQVRLNTGNGFSTEVLTWTNASTLDLNSSATESGNLAFTVGFMIFGVKFTVNPSVNLGDGMSRDLAKIQDINGDGNPDYITSSKDDNLAVALSTIGRTNLLKSVSRPMGAYFCMDYQRVGNTYSMPNSIWTLSSVKVYDGFAGDGPDTLLTTFGYEGGYFDRDEREFYGFKKVVTRSHDAANNNAVYTFSTQTHSNDNYYMKGVILSELLQSADGKKYHERINQYALKDILTGDALPESYKANNAGAAFVALMRTDLLYYEGQPQPGKSTYMTYGYDAKGNTILYTDFGDDGAGDDISATVTYHNLANKYIVGKPKSIVITGSGITYRKRESKIDPQTGDVIEIKQYLEDGTAAVHNLTYDDYGNLASVTGPANAKGQRFKQTYTYDGQVHQYPVTVANSFGYSSQSEYDFRFGHPLKSIDLNKNSITYQLDDLGRITQITGPYELAAGKPYTLRFEYHPEAAMPWAYTAHYDPAHPGNDLETVTFMDGLGRLLQTKKDGSLFQGVRKDDKEQMLVSGRIQFDGLGRQAATWYPIVEDKGSNGVFNKRYDNINPTTTTYDVMNRVLTTTLPDGAVTSLTYGFGKDRLQQQQFSTKTKDANGKLSEMFANIRGLTAAEKKYTGNGDVWTSFTYDAVNQQLTSTDDIGTTTTTRYDMLGRRVSLTHPDQGTTRYTFDLAGNTIKMATANLQQDSMAITYAYDFNRMTGITYPKNPENNVRYTYGPVGAPYNRAGRIVVQEDATGAQEFFYGPLGEMVKNVRTIVIPNHGQRTYVTQWNYDTWNRLISLIYPDSEVVRYAYNLGGQLLSMNSDRSGVTTTFIQQRGYDKFELRVFDAYGNNTQTNYTIEPTRRRLQNMQVTAGNGRRIMDNVYSYDKEENILSLVNNAPVPGNNLMGGSSAYNYGYDDLYRLTTADGYYKGPNEQDRFNLTMKYNTVGSITRKTQTTDKSPGNGGGNKWIAQKKATYDMEYTYDAKQPHTATHIGDQSYTYDANGNMTGWTDDKSGQRQKMVWDEENRLRNVSVNGQLNSYTYDGSGERVLKGQGSGQSVFVNGDINSNSGGVGNFTVYVNEFVVVQSGQYSNHYFVGNQRIATRLLHNWDHQVEAPDAADTITFTRKEKNMLQGMARDQQTLVGNGNANTASITGKDARGNDDKVMSNNGNGNENNNSNSNAGGTNPGNHYAYGHYKNGKGGNTPDSAAFLYFYHPDHLGTTSYITDGAGEVYQHLEYYPFGETFVEEHSNTQRTPYLFNGKELDEETGLYYYGERYYNPRISIWQSVDPKAVKIPAHSPYAYCLNNPVVLMDPDGAYPIITITKQKTGRTTLQRIIGYTGATKEQFTKIPLYKVTVTDTEDKNFKMTFSVTRDAYAVRLGDSKNGTMNLTNVAFEPKDGNVNHYTAKVMPEGYPQGNGTKALKLTQYGSEVMHADANDASVELGYRKQNDVASGVMIHVGGTYEHANGTTSMAASEGCFGVTYGTSSSTNPANDYSNNVLGKIIDQANKSKTNKGKIEVIVEKRTAAERTQTKTEPIQ